MPGVRAHPAAGGLDDQHAGLGAHHPPRLREDQLDHPRVLPQLGGQLAGALARRHLGQRSDPPLGLRDRLLGDDDRRRRRPGRAPPRRPRRRSGAPSSRSGGDLRQAADRDDLQVGAHRRVRSRGPVDASASAVCGARSGRAASTAARAARSSGVSRSSASDSSGSRATASPARSARSRWRAELSGPERGADRVGGREQEAVGAGSVAVGDHGHAAGVPSAPSAASSSAGLEQRAVAGQQRRALGAERQRPDDPEGRRLRVAAVDRLAQDLERGRRALGVVQRQPLGAPLAGDDDQALDRLRGARGGEHVGEHRLHDRRRAAGGRGGPAAAASRGRSASPG